MASTVRVWDLPTRLFHWLLASAIVGLFMTAQIGGLAMEWHFRFGYLTLSLILFRLVWGLIGGHWSRFSSFLCSPMELVHYIKGKHRPEHTLGHNPLGGFSVVLMLFFLLLQVASGMFSDDEISAYGPLGKFVSNGIVSKATYYHTQVGKFVLLSLIAIHLFAIGFYFFVKRTDLVTPMVSGDKESFFGAKFSRDDLGSRFGALVVFLVGGSLVLTLLMLAN